ncbi:unnamed protein product [marine sediment metagenome]|uniref:Uncharacterized protein n=1 Tax=marine sediment metagenome TaxID=412755 RepID=X1AJ05_9ZZZZ
MSEDGTKVSISPETIETLKEKYNLSQEGVREFLDNVEVIAPIQTSAPPAKLEKAPDGDTSGEKQIMTQMMHGDLSMAEVIMYMDMQDRKDRRERRERREDETPKWAEKLLAYIKNEKE